MNVFVVIRWVEEPPQWDVLEVSQCPKEVKFLASTGNLKKAINSTFDFPWEEETAPAQLLDFGKRNAMEKRRTEFVQEYENSLPSGKGCRNKKRKNLDLDEEISDETQSTQSVEISATCKGKKKKLNNTACDAAILDAAQQTNSAPKDKAVVSSCSKCSGHFQLKAKYKALKKEKKELESQLAHFKNVADAGDLVKSLKELCDGLKVKKAAPVIPGSSFTQGSSSEAESSSSSQQPSEASPWTSSPASVENEVTNANKDDRVARGSVGEPMNSPHCKIKESIKVDIGRGVTVNKISLLALNSSAKSATIFARKLLMLIFTEEELIGKSLTGKKSNAHKASEAREGLDPIKIEAICDLTKRKFPSTDTGVVKNSLSNKLKEMRKKSQKKVEDSQVKEKDNGIEAILGEKDNEIEAILGDS